MASTLMNARFHQMAPQMNPHIHLVSTDECAHSSFGPTLCRRMNAHIHQTKLILQSLGSITNLDI